MSRHMSLASAMDETKYAAREALGCKLKLIEIYVQGQRHLLCREMRLSKQTHTRDVIITCDKLAFIMKMELTRLITPSLETCLGYGNSS